MAISTTSQIQYHNVISSQINIGGRIVTCGESGSTKYFSVVCDEHNEEGWYKGTSEIAFFVNDIEEARNIAIQLMESLESLLKESS